jgi:hypothetical protein
LEGRRNAFGEIYKGIYKKMRPHELRDLLESRREYVTNGVALELIAVLQQDLDLLENEYEQEIREVLNGTGYTVQDVVFNIDIDTGHKIEIFPSGVRYVKVKKRMLRPEDSESQGNDR